MVMSIERAAFEIEAMAAEVEIRLRRGLERGAVTIEREAKREIGHYQRAVGPLPGWPRLRPVTLREKTALGYSPPDNPLLRTGKLRDSIDHAISGSGAEMEADVGANGVVAVVQERGGGHVPARSFLERAARRKEAQVVRTLERALGRAVRALP